MQNTQIRRNRILFALWTLVLLVLFFFKGQAAVSALLLFTVIYAIAAYLLTRLSGRKLTAGFTGGDMVSKGETITIKMELQNRGNCRSFVVPERRKR